jgi:hypothetical protein
MFEATKIIHQNNDWITLVFIIIFIVLALTKTLFKDRLYHVFRLFFFKYHLSIYFNKEKLTPFNLFQTLLFIVQLLVLSLVFYFSSAYFQFESNFFNFNSFILIVCWVGLYFSLRYLIGVLLSFLFNLKKEYNKIVYDKITYFNNLILWILPFLIFSVYFNEYKKLFLEITLSLFVLLLTLRYGLTLLNNKKYIFNNLFYFILYLCALEIAPLIIILKLSI